MASTRTVTRQEELQDWAESLGGRPACTKEVAAWNSWFAPFATETRRAGEAGDADAEDEDDDEDLDDDELDTDDDDDDAVDAEDDDDEEDEDEDEDEDEEGGSTAAPGTGPLG
jgi:hypothetical protein